MKKKIFLYLCGGLGNQLFQYAAAKNLAIKNNAKIVIDTGTGFLRTIIGLSRFDFPRSEFVLDIKKFNNIDLIKFSLVFFLYKIKKKLFIKKIFNNFKNLILIDEMGLKYFDRRISNFIFEKNLYLMGYFQSEKYFLENTKNIIKTLIPRKPKEKKYLYLKNKIISNNSVAICVRAYEELSDNYSKKAMGGVANLSYYKNSINLIKKNSKNINYFLFSTKKLNLQNLIKKIKTLKTAQHQKRLFIITSDTGFEDAYANLWLMSFFKKIIISNSSLYWWGMYFAKFRQKKIQYFVSTNFINKDSTRFK
jgi:hypothetical protein